ATAGEGGEAAVRADRPERGRHAQGGRWLGERPGAQAEPGGAAGHPGERAGPGQATRL
ncbi:MAG: hypothetical protein AVDCRST_MAG08-599, partial [uncultured Acetobacteraceae bacterium]